MLIDDLEPQRQPAKPKQLDTLSVDELKTYVAELKAEIARVETAITAKEAHIAAMSALFKKPG